MIGGLGGFILPIAFGAAQRPDRPLDELLHAALRCSSWSRWSGCISPIRKMERTRAMPSLAVAAASEGNGNRMTEKLVIIGNGMAPGRMLEHLLREGARPLPGHDLQRRAARQLRPHHAVAGSVRREGLRGDHHPRRRLVHQERHHALQGPQDRRDRPRRQDRHLRPRRHRALRQAGRSPPAPCPSSSRCPATTCPASLTYRDLDDVQAMLLAAQSRDKGGGHRRRPAGPGSRRRSCARAAWTSPCCTSCRR